MNVGLPGTGIGGLLYLVMALLMPVHEAALALSGRSSHERWRSVAQQWAVAATILGSLTAVGYVIGELAFRVDGLGSPGVSRAVADAQLWASPLLVSLVTLAAVLLAVQLARALHAAHGAPVHRDPRGRVR